MTTYNRHYRSKKFFLCVHSGEKNTIGFEHESNRHTQFSFVHHGNGTYYAFDDKDNISVVKGSGKEELIDLREHKNSSVVIRSTSDYKFISFNPWRKEINWSGRLIDKSETQIKSARSYSCLIAFKNSFKINDIEIPEMSCVDLDTDREYEIEIGDSFVGFFEELPY
tara:strand:- start:61 stop:561 length:501 start_codon:yes stop_codon:yes gene_type:complete